MFSGQRIGYSRDVDADVHEPPGQSAEPAHERKGLRALFGRSSAEDDAAADTRADADDAPSAADAASGAEDAPSGGIEPGGMEPDDNTPTASSGTASAAPAAPGTASVSGTSHAGTKPPPATAARAPAATSAPGSPRLATAARVTTASRATAGPPPAAAARSAAGSRPARRQPVYPLVSRPLVNPRLRADPRLRVWVVRTVVALAVFIGFSIGLGWRYGVTAAAIYAAADAIYRSKTTAVVPAAVRVTSAQRYTRRRLKVLQPAGYMALHARTIPGTKHVIDHVVVGPAGVFTIDSQRLDRRLPLRAIGGMLYHGQSSMEDRMDHAQMEARQAAKLIAAEVGQRVRVRPAIVMYGPNIPWVIMKFKGVDVFDGSRVGTYFRRQSKATAAHRLTSGQIAMVLAAAARALPPLN